MKLLVSICVFALLVTGVALGAIKENTPKPRVTTQELARANKEAAPLPALVLPNAKALVKQAWKVDRKVIATQQKKSAHVLAFFNGKGKWLRATRHEKCWEVAWQRSCTLARAVYKLHSALGQVATRRLLYELPATDDWRTAVNVAQRPYPGTADRLMSLSDREGGWGDWVWYGGRPWSGGHIGDDFLGADTVGGWMQFRYSTFAPYWRAAQADLRRRGFLIPPIQMPPEGGPAKYAGWLSPMGQALTAAYMHYYDKQGCHWCL